jgi:hypothetical protein
MHDLFDDDSLIQSYIKLRKDSEFFLQIRNRFEFWNQDFHDTPSY